MNRLDQFVEEANQRYKSFGPTKGGSPATTPRNMLNLGCGSTYHPHWINIDIAPGAADVIACDFRKGLPFAAASCDAVYHSHLLEHLSRDEGEMLMVEVARVLRPGGTVRIVVPDLERIAVLYLEKLAAVVAGGVEARQDYEWMLLELLDQMVRQHRGGFMREYLLRPNLRNATFVRSRIGAEFDAVGGSRAPTSLLTRLQRKGMRRILAMARAHAARAAVRIVGGWRACASYEVGLFRDGGEVHKWMYDRYSLARLMERVGIVSIKQCDAITSRIPDFATYGLDSMNGEPRKPDSLYMEGLKSRS